MAATDSHVRRRMIAGAADMISRRGLNATSVRDLAKHTGTPLGSTYHYFPGGKDQLAVEAVRHAGAQVSEQLRTALDAGPVQGLQAFLTLWRGILTDTDYRVGCAVLAVAVEEPTDDTTRALDAAAEVFTEWETIIADSLRTHGADTATADDLATLVVNAVEGSVATCRARRDTHTLDVVARQLETLVIAAVRPPHT